MDNGIGRLPEVMKLTGLSKSTIYAMIDAGEFPMQISLGGRAVGWLREEIWEWINKRIEISRRYVDPNDGDDNED